MSRAVRSSTPRCGSSKCPANKLYVTIMSIVETDVWNRWKNAVEAQDMMGMTHARDKLVAHLERFYEHLSITRADVEREGLGLRPITAAENLSRSDRSVLARRYYRLAQWNETLQESYWITASSFTLKIADLTSDLSLGPGLRGVSILHYRKQV